MKDFQSSKQVPWRDKTEAAPGKKSSYSMWGANEFEDRVVCHRLMNVDFINVMVNETSRTQPKSSSECLKHRKHMGLVARYV